MLDPDAPDERRDQIATDARRRIETGGSLKAENAWGMRKLAYEIQQRTEADYRFFRFQTERPLLAELDHDLKITDGVLRFRIFKVDPSSPVIEPPPPVSLAASAPSRGPGGRRGGPGGSGARPPREDSGDGAPARAEAPATEAPAPEAPPAPAVPEDRATSETAPAEAPAQPEQDRAAE